MADLYENENYDEDSIEETMEDDLEEEPMEEDLEEENICQNDSNFFNTCKDNSVDWYTGEKTITCTFSQRKWVNKIKKLAKSHPNDVTIVFENTDGSIIAKLPLAYFKLTPPRQVSDEQRERMRIVAKKNVAEGKLGRKPKNT